MNIQITDVTAKELEGLIDKLRSNPQQVVQSSDDVHQLRQQVHQLAIVVEKLASPQQVQVQYPQRQLPSSAPQLYLPEAPARLQTSPTPLPATEQQEPGVPFLPWLERWTPWISALMIGGTIGFIALRMGVFAPQVKPPVVGTPAPSSNLLKVPKPPAGKGTPPPPPNSKLTLPAIPQLNP